ncbi:MAG: lipoyl(octanoyl) transferase LipB [Euryarchaeota archaeon]|jgi:lipoate-protein ligase B|nr:lipoyl(octanoyl) transferase LipB [Euryarchaeota archaeon]MBT4925617.1 lipoyl(octanoyl) transferase LipB [Euryarchaeota archaeon]MBT5735522.1 lipoyl(octanoyl) transferase LipB [Euryarchaeota archaeon]MBT7459923.1 lipoyl(octanoyl) transferase LipB [Euryarchaeota archaeon]
MTEIRKVKIMNLGITPYEDSLELMKELQAKRINDEIIDTLIFLQHPEIVTVGPRARNDGIKPPSNYPSFPVDRGGGLTWHGPGQLVAYPIFKWNLGDENSVAQIISKLERWVIGTLLELKIDSSIDERMQGVWVDGKKISSIGLSFLRWTSRHGLTINYDTPESRVELLSGCGLDAQTTTSLSRLGYDVTFEQLMEKLSSTMLEFLNRETQ